MKAKYEKPTIEVVDFQMENYLMNGDPAMSGEIIEGEDPPF